MSGSWGLDAVTVQLGDQLAVDGISLDVPAGTITGVVGGDGAGKSTLLRCLVGVVAHQGGHVRRPGATRIGYVASNSGTYPDLSVAENLEFAASGYGVPVTAMRVRVAEYLERTGLAATRDRLAGQLSGGMRQKLGAIRAMIHDPALLVLDEPTTGVDPVSRTDLWWLITRAAARGAAVVLSTTYLDEADRASSLLVLDRGRTLATGTPEEIVADIPGAIRSIPDRPVGDDAPRSWRRAGRWRVWVPDEADLGHEGVGPDLQDAVTVAALAAELA